MLKMLEEIHEICEQYDIRYSLCGGSLIGACRNEGFLPWDDDADVMMTYDNWVKFREVCRTCLPENRALLSIEESEGHSNALPRYMSLDSTSIHPHQTFNDAPAGIVIDILILDPVSDDEGELDAYRQDLAILSDLVNYSSNAGFRYDVTRERLEEVYAYRKANGLKAAIDECLRRLMSHFSDESSCYVCRWFGHPIGYRRSWFDSYRLLPFEGKKLYGPIGTYEWLACNFGEEWTDVPGDITPSRHQAAISIDLSYDKALEYFHPKQSEEQFLADGRQRKLLTTEIMPVKARGKWMRNHAKGEVVLRQVAEAIAQDTEGFDVAYAAKDANALSSFLGGYVALQSSGDLIGRGDSIAIYSYFHPQLLEVDQRVFTAMLYVLMETQRIRHAARLLEVWQLKGKDLTSDMEEIEYVIELFNESNALYQYEEYEQGYEFALETVELFPRIAAFRKLVMRFLNYFMVESPSPQTIAAVREYAEACKSAFPGDGFFDKQLADCLWQEGQTTEAIDLYVDAAERTRDGYALLDINKRIGYQPTWIRNTTWGKRYGVLQWDYEMRCAYDPQDPAWIAKKSQNIVDDLRPANQTESTFEKAREKNLSTNADDVQRFLFKLLCELCRFCDEHEIEYVLSRRISKAFFKFGMLPDTPKQYSIIVDGDNMLKLVDALKHDMPANRSIEYMGNSPFCDDRMLHYCASDTLALDFIAKTSNDAYDLLCVDVRPLEVKEYPPEIEAALAERGKLHRRLRRRKIDVASIETAGGAELFKDCMVYSAQHSGHSLRYRSSAPSVLRKKYFEERERILFQGCWFSVPVELEAWLNSGNELEQPNRRIRPFKGRLLYADRSLEPLFSEKASVDLLSGVDAYQRYLFGLLVELCEFCDAQGIEYRLSRNIAKCFYRYGKLPQKVSQYALLMSGPSMLKLLEALQENLPSNRSFEYMGNSSFVATRYIRYCGQDSLMLDTASFYPNWDYSHLGVYVKPLEPLEYPADLESKIATWSYLSYSLKTHANVPQCGLDSEVERAFADSALRAEMGHNLFVSAMGGTDESASYIRAAASNTQIQEPFLTDKLVRVPFCGYAFNVPEYVHMWAFGGSKIELTNGIQFGGGVVASLDATIDDARRLFDWNVEYFEPRRSIREKDKRNNEYLQSFKDNFEAVCVAVKLKEISLDLLPRKATIVKLYKKKDVRRLRRILAKYLALAKGREITDDLKFDDEIFEAMLFCQG